MAQLIKKLRELQAEPPTNPPDIQKYGATAAPVAGNAQQSGVLRLGGLVTDWMLHIGGAVALSDTGATEASRKEWVSEEQAFVRRIMNQTMATYRFGSTGSTAS